MARTGEKLAGFRNCIKKLSLSIPDKLKIQDVIVVPILAPMMIPMACDNFIIPEFTKPTTITVVAEEDCITAVTKAPRQTARSGLDVNFYKIRSNFPPDIFVNPSPIVCIPYRKSARPPSMESTPKIFMGFSFQIAYFKYFSHFTIIVYLCKIQIYLM